MSTGLRTGMFLLISRTEHGGAVTEEGIAVPISGVRSFKISQHL